MIARAASWPPSGGPRTRGQARAHPVHRHRHADNARGRDEHQVRRDAELRGGQAGRLARVLEALRAVAGVGVARVENDRLGATAGGLQRSRLSSTGAAGKAFWVNVAAATHSTSDAQIPRSGLPEGLMPAASAPALKPRGAGRASRRRVVRMNGNRGCGGHGSIGTSSSPSCSGQPSIRFMFWTAWPAAPLPRLSTAPSAMTVSASGSAA